MTPAPTHPHVRLVVDGHVATLTLDAPQRLNAVDSGMLAHLAATYRRLGADPGVRVVVLTGDGRGFCSGADLSGADTTTLEEGARAVTAIRDADVTTVARVGGIAAGVGVSLALACDYVLASDDAAFMLAFTKIGLVPDGGATALVAASIGRARALRLALTAEKLPAALAEQWGMIAECVPADRLDERTAQLAADLAAAAPLAATATAAAINAAALAGLDAALAREIEVQTRLLASQDFAEGVAAFRDKRPARFTGR